MSLVHGQSPNPDATTMHVTDAGSARPDLLARREVKFALPGADAGKLRALLAGNLRRIRHNDEVSIVRSVYFDDFRLSACHANLAGLGRRQKLRIRWYDREQAPDDFFLEIKWRDGYVTGKHRLRVRSGTPLHRLPYAQWLPALAEVAPETYIVALARMCEPKVLVEYRREHFGSDDGVRVTLDYDLAFYDQTSTAFASTRFRRAMPGHVIVEAKAPVGHHMNVRRALGSFRVRPTRSSKYVLGCAVLGLADPRTQSLY